MEPFHPLPITKNLKEKIKFYKNPSPLRFGVDIVPLMAVSEYKDGKWSDLSIEEYKNISISPCAKALNYGHQIFEGMKAFRSNNSAPLIFRPDLHAKRMRSSANRLEMPEIPEDLFLEAVRNVTYYCSNHIPQGEAESLYIRPLLIGTTDKLTLDPSDEFKFMVFASPSAGYLDLSTENKALIERNNSRASKGGTGSIKAGGNYAGAIKSSINSAKLGFSQIVWLDPEKKSIVEEFSGMNFFALINGELFTPSLTDTLLPGITRKTIIELSSFLGIPLHECSLQIDELLEEIKSGRCTEIFACGTAAAITPITALGEATGETFKLKESFGPITKKLRETLLAIQNGNMEIQSPWVEKVPMYQD